MAKRTVFLYLDAVLAGEVVDEDVCIEVVEGLLIEVFFL